MNRSDFFRRLGLAVAALFAPKGVKGKWLETARGIGEEPFTVSITNCRFVDCRFEEPIKAPRRGGLVKVPQGVTLRIDGRFSAGPYQVFDLSEGGRVEFGPCATQYMKPEWFGAVGEDR